MDQESADLILSFQAQDLADLHQELSTNTHDSTTNDSRLALELYEEELRIAASLVRDQAYGKKVGLLEDRSDAPPSTVVSPTPDFDRIVAEAIAPLTIDKISDIHDDVEKQLSHTANQSQEQVTPDTFQSDTSLDVSAKKDQKEKRVSLPSRMAKLLGFAGVSEHEENIPEPVVYPCVACNICEKEDDMVHAPCGDYYCETCIKQLFTMAMKEESLFPPRCCRQPIPLELASSALGAELEESFATKSIELTSTDRTYYFQSTCGIFIPPFAIDNEKAWCSECGSVTCTTCKGGEHEGDCPASPDHEALMDLAAKEGYQKCYQCKRLVEISTGCNHMT